MYTITLIYGDKEYTYQTEVQNNNSRRAYYRACTNAVRQHLAIYSDHPVVPDYVKSVKNATA